MKPVTDPALLEQLDGGAPSAPKPVTDPALLAELNGPALSPASPRSAKPLPVSGGGAEFVGGNMMKGAANVVGMPIDFATNVGNLGRAAYGTVKGAMGGSPTELLGPQVGGSAWIQDLMRRTKLPFSGAPMIGPGAEPESPLGRYGAAAIQMGVGAGIPGAMAGRLPGGARTLPNVPRAVAGGAASGVTSELAGDIGGEEYKSLGAMIPQMGAISTPGPGQRATSQRKEQSFVKAKEMGIPIPPRAMKDNPIQQKLQDFANQDLKQPAGAPVTPEGLAAYRAPHWQAYQAVMKDPALAQGVKPTPAFQKTIKDLGDEIMRTQTELPQTFKAMQPVVQLLKEYGYGAKAPPQYSAAVLARNPQLAQQPAGKPIPPDIAMRAIKKLRDDASTNFSSEKPEKVEMAKVQKQLANSLEQLIDDNLPTGSTAVQQFREARTSIAKSHDYEDALDPTTRQIDPERLSRLQTGGRPLSGRSADIAQVTGAFPDAMQTPSGSGQDILTHKMSPHAALYPTNWIPHMLHRMTDPLTMSRPYQAFQVDPRARLTPEQQRIQALLAAAMASQQGQIPAPPR
jgi:hypothetical protein